MMRHGPGALVDRMGAQIGDAVLDRLACLLGRGLLAGPWPGSVGRDMDGHVAARVIHDDPFRIGAATRARFAIEHRPDVAPRAEEFLRELAVRLHVHHATEMYCVSRNSISPSCAPSRPMPDCFMPPNGAAGSETSPRLSPIMPNSSFSETRMPRLKSLV